MSSASRASKLYETLLIIMIGTHNLRIEKNARKLAATAIVAAGMDEKLANELLDDMDIHYNKVKCRKIEQMLPKLMKMVEEELKSLTQRG